MPKTKAVKEIELEPDAWQRFERFIGRVKTEPKHQPPAKKKPRKTRRKA